MARETPRLPRLLRRLRRILLWTVGGLVGLVTLAVLLLLLAPVRSALLEWGLETARPYLPGDLTVQRATWPRPGGLRFEGPLWTAGGDTLVSAAELEVAVRLPRLLAREIQVETLLARGLRADVPALTALLAKPDSTAKTGETKKGGSGPFHPGALPMAPAFSVDRVDIDAPHIRVADGTTLVDLQLRGSCNNLPGEGPWLRLETLAGETEETGWPLAADSLVFDLPHEEWAGSLRADLGPDWPLRLRLADAPGPGGFLLDLEAGPSAGGEAALRLEVTGEARLEGHELREVEGTARFRIPPPEVLATLPLVGEKLPPLPPLEGVEGTLAGRYEFSSVGAFGARLDLDPNAWLEGGTLVAHGERSDVVLDSLSLAFPELIVSASGELHAESLSADASVNLTGLAWMPALGLGAPFADSLHAAVEIGVRGPRAHPDLELRGTAAARFGGVTVEGVSFAADLPEGGQLPADWSLEAQVLELIVAGQGQLTLGPEMQVEMSPIMVRETTAPPAPFPSSRGTVQVAAGALRADGIRIEGVLGSLVLNTSLDANKVGSAEITVSWPAAPPPLLARVAPVDSVAAALSQHWREDGPFGLHLATSLDLSSGTTARGFAEVHLPGPSTLDPLLPPGARVNDLGPIDVRLDFEFAGTESGSRFDVLADPAATSWIEGSPIHLEGNDGTLHLDSLDVAIEGVRLSGSGRRDPETVAAALELSIGDETMLRRLLPQLAETDSVRALLVVSAEGSADDPRIRADLEGSMKLAAIQIPRIQLQADLEDGIASLTARTPEGMTAGPVVLDSLRADYRTLVANSLPFPGRIFLDAQGPELRARNVTEIHREGGWNLRVDSLTVAVAGNELRSERPFLMEMRESGGWSLRDLLLVGNLGRVEADGMALPDNLHARARVALALAGVPRPPQVPSEFWPRTFEMDFTAEDTVEWQLSATAAGMSLPDGKALTLEVGATGHSDRTSAQVSADAAGRILMEGSIEVPAALVLSPFHFTMRDGDIAADLRHENLPLPVDALNLQAPGLRGSMLNGYMRVRGTMSRPQGRIDLSLHVPQPGKAPPLRVALVGQLVTGETAGAGDALSDSIATLAEDMPPLQGTGLRAALVLDRGSERLLRGGLNLPVAWTDQKIEIAPPGREADLKLRSEAFPLEVLLSFLPPRAGLAGNLDLEFRAHGGLEDPDLSGRIRSSQTSLTLRSGLKITNTTSLTLAGSALAPELSGKIVVLSGVIPIPESPAERHPVEGEALLWNLAAYAPASPDSNADGSPRAPASPPPPRVHPKVDVTIEVPTGLWIRGRDLNVELSGDLRLRMEKEIPIVVGNLKARSGTLTLLGRSFDVSTGTVTFYGEETINPRLDIEMESKISSTLVKVLVTGTAEKPELKLTSEPEMSETDILSLIVFGRSSSDLNGDEVQLMTKQAATMAAVYGTAGLTQSLSRELGVDMLTINPSGGSSGQSTVVVGKYLDPRTLIKYEQTLEGVSEFFVTLQYRLTNYLTVETLVGPTQSGAGVSWTRDY